MRHRRRWAASVAALVAAVAVDGGDEGATLGELPRGGSCGGWWPLAADAETADGTQAGGWPQFATATPDSCDGEWLSWGHATICCDRLSRWCRELVLKARLALTEDTTCTRQRPEWAAWLAWVDADALARKQMPGRWRSELAVATADGTANGTANGTADGTADGTDAYEGSWEYPGAPQPTTEDPPAHRFVTIGPWGFAMAVGPAFEALPQYCYRGANVRCPPAPHPDTLWELSGDEFGGLAACELKCSRSSSGSHSSGSNTSSCTHVAYNTASKTCVACAGMGNATAESGYLLYGCV